MWIENCPFKKGTFRENPKEQYPVWGFQGRCLIKSKLSCVMSLKS